MDPVREATEGQGQRVLKRCATAETAHQLAYSPRRSHIAIALLGRSTVVVRDVERDKRVTQFSLPDQVDGVAWKN